MYISVMIMQGVELPDVGCLGFFSFRRMTQNFLKSKCRP